MGAYVQGHTMSGESILACHHVSFEAQTQVARTGGNSSYLLSHLTGLGWILFRWSLLILSYQTRFFSCPQATIGQISPTQHFLIPFTNIQKGLGSGTFSLPMHSILLL